MDKIKILVVDDSALMRKFVSDLINQEDDMEAIATARNGKELLSKLIDLKPDVITLDVEMPEMDGIATLKELKASRINIPVIMLSSLTASGSRLTMDCLKLGAFDFVQKPSGSISLDIKKVAKDLTEKIRNTRFYNKNRRITSPMKLPEVAVDIVGKGKKIEGKIKAVVIGASTGGPKALNNVLPFLPKNLDVPVFVVQHMPKGFTKAFAERLNETSDMHVVEAEHGMIIENNTIYIAKAGYHMEVGADKRIYLNEEPSIWGVRPAVDKLFLSSSKVYGKNLLSVILTGMGKDGAQGTAAVKDAGGITISEDERTCTIYGMPKAAYETGKVDLVLPLNEIKNTIVKIIKENL
ncbi:protein-glutamate methylesterase/protein-glutamine glutaminase [Clostridium sp. 'White wine YQ']|uniref:protein-glutamate methylesterase/protein-glutamine glutaminase n=1 Tax=Clostridium sp. 'White wine YQ' TaxID=3027474 RepID=UPI002366C41C|nr:chemotaxis response regulator protein-glutamate methylesterase [Clostridium sp. 'White wine YQ']MDD7794643.1 chemotaxis response regulator protein-glutamate methylesterase [Clostridium sp. 'White wine YQ']